MPRVLIIGYGNPLRGDDAIGYLAAERLASIITDPGVEVQAVHQLTPELAERVSQAEKVIFLDAAVEGDSGAIQKRAIVPFAHVQAWTHSSTPEALLSMASALYGAAPPATLYSVRAESFELGGQLSPKLLKGLDLLVATVITDLSSSQT